MQEKQSTMAWMIVGKTIATSVRFRFGDHC